MDKGTTQSQFPRVLVGSLDWLNCDELHYDMSGANNKEIDTSTTTKSMQFPMFDNWKSTPSSILFNELLSRESTRGRQEGDEKIGRLASLLEKIKGIQFVNLHLLFRYLSLNQPAKPTFSKDSFTHLVQVFSRESGSDYHWSTCLLAKPENSGLAKSKVFLSRRGKQV